MTNTELKVALLALASSHPTEDFPEEACPLAVAEDESEAPETRSLAVAAAAARLAALLD